MRTIKKYGFVFTLVFFAMKLYPQLEAKANVLTSLGLIPNVGIEIQTGEKNSIQLDVLASFWNKLNNSKTPLHINQTFLEYRFYDNDTYQSGRVAFYGFTIGYKKRISQRISLEAFIGGGYSIANYKAYREDTRLDIRDNWRTFNRSGEFVAYRGGLMINYKFKPYKKK